MILRYALAMSTCLVGCVLDGDCEPYIEYSKPSGAQGQGCPSLMFEDQPVPARWYPTSTIAYVQDCTTSKPRSYICGTISPGEWTPKVVSGES